MQYRQSFNEQLMILAEGNMMQYEILQRGNIGDYLIKLENYVRMIERKIESQKRI